MKNIIENASTLIYFIAALVLVGISLLIVGWSVYEIFHELIIPLNKDANFVAQTLQSVGAIVIAIAILDVAKYMIDEEVLKNKELRTPKEARETLTKIIVIVSIAINIEALVYIFKAGVYDLKLLIYPSFLIFSSVSLIVGLGVYQKLSKDLEIKTDNS